MEETITKYQKIRDMEEGEYRAEEGNVDLKLGEVGRKNLT